MQARPQLKALKPVAPYDRNPAKALAQCFDRTTGEKIRKNQLKTNHDALAQYHLHSETKFLNGEYNDKGKTQRRHIVVKSIQHIGKEANKWHEQSFTGFDPDAQLEYGISAEQKDEILKSVLQAVTIYGAKNVALAAKLSARHVRDISKGKTNPSELVFIKLQSAVKILESVNASEQGLRQKIKEMMEEKNISIRSIAAKFEIDASNLAKVLSGLRSSKDQLIRMHAYLMELAEGHN